MCSFSRIAKGYHSLSQEGDDDGHAYGSEEYQKHQITRKHLFVGKKYNNEDYDEGGVEVDSNIDYKAIMMLISVTIRMMDVAVIICN